MPPTFSPSEYRDSFADALASVTLLVRGKKQEGGFYWAYIAMKPSMISQLQDARKRGMFDLDEYGTILESGDEEFPPQEIVVRMAEMYGLPIAKEMEILKQFD